VAEGPGDALQVNVKVIPGVQDYTELLERPSYAIIAMDNLGVKVVNSGKITILGGSAFRYKSMTLRFSEKRGQLYLYTGRVGWNSDGEIRGIDFTVEVDTSGMNNGVVALCVRTPLVRMLPRDLTDMIALKVQLLTNELIQEKILAYFARLEGKGVKGAAGLGELILIDSYNLRSNIPDRGSAAPPGWLSYKPVVVAFLALALVGTSIFLMVRWKKDRKKA
jgi:hypothetical protein